MAQLKLKIAEAKELATTVTETEAYKNTLETLKPAKKQEKPAAAEGEASKEEGAAAEAPKEEAAETAEDKEEKKDEVKEDWNKWEFLTELTGPDEVMVSTVHDPMRVRPSASR